jgi:uncharacterized protein (TIGR02217 family)
MSFLETPRFPDEIAAWATGGRGFKTTVVETYGGNEYRNAAWSQRRGEWEMVNAWRVPNAAIATYNATQLINFLNTAQGQWGGFRFKDFLDYKDNDMGGAGIFQLITATTFQMYKRYTLGALTYDAKILKPISPIVVTGGVSPSVNYATGVVTVASGTPTAWTGTYDVPVRFAEDVPRIGLDEGSGALLNWQSLKLIELKNL